MFRKIIIPISLILIFVLMAAAQNSKTLSAEAVLQKTAAKLSSLKTIKYKYNQEYNYASEAYLAKSKADCFLEFTPFETNLGLKFQFRDDNSSIVYNGSEIFQLNEKGKTIKVESKPKSDRLDSSTYLQFSPLMWRNVLPKIIADKSLLKSISETKVNNVSYYLVEFALDKAFIDSGNGKILPMTIDRKTIYRLTIDKQNYLPIEIYRGNNVNQDFNKTTYSELVENPTPPTENSWYYSTYLNEYTYAEPLKDNLIKTGEVAYEINLPMFETDKTVSLNDYNGKVVLLDFWIFHCGYCQASVPKLNALQDKFKDKNFNLLAVNVTDSKELINLFIKNTKSKLSILYQGEEVAKKYGVAGYPTVVLIDKNGKVLYSGGFDQTKIENLINQNL
ncbi:MAG TPA: TlpA disulfide reductase family protein [Pyrinomonadaceae bacterium]|nr:TlpA disulfide reductase family protein [Pyrinomonadaceae bacterium]